MKVVTRRFLAALLLAVAALAIGCSGDGDAEPGAGLTATSPASSTSTPRPDPTATVEDTATSEPTTPETPEPTATTEPTSASVPSGTQSGIAEIDAILADLVADDAAGLAEHVAMMETACTYAQGLGGPPKCWALPGSPPEGTIVNAFPSASCEGSWQFDPAEVARSVIDPDPELYGVVEFETPQPLYRSEPGYPMLEYLILLQQRQATGTERVGTFLGVSDGKIVTKSLVCLGPPEMALDRFGPAEYVLYGPGYE